MDTQLKYKKAMADFLGCTSDQLTLAWKGRVGLYGLLEALNIRPEDEIIIPAFTCVVVANAIIYLGAKPVYVDIDPLTYNIDINQIEEKITSKTVAIIAQNTFGLSSDFDRINSIGRQHNLHVLEDCTHGFGGTYKGKPNGTLAKGAFYSSQWNKTFSTGIGGMTICNDPELARKLKDFEDRLTSPSLRESTMLRLQLFVKNKLLTQSVYWIAIKLYRFLTKNNIITGSSQGAELESPVMTDDFLKGISNVQAKEGIRQMQLLDKNLKHRRTIAGRYHEALRSINITPPFEPIYSQHTFIKYPILVKDKSKFLALAEKNLIPLGDWFLRPIHPIEKNYHLWHYDYGAFPVAEKISQHILNLPTDLSISMENSKKIADFIISNATELTTCSKLLKEQNL